MNTPEEALQSHILLDPDINKRIMEGMIDVFNNYAVHDDALKRFLYIFFNNPLVVDAFREFLRHRMRIQVDKQFETDMFRISFDIF